MDAAEADDGGSSTIAIRVLSVAPAHAGRLFALAAVEIDIDGILIEIHGIRAMRVDSGPGTRIELPTLRNAAGLSQPAIILPEEVRGPIGDAVLEALIEHGLAKRRFAPGGAGMIA